ncbi:MAG: MFS transporter [Promethearchaeota archaeon]|jgi:MFS family permease
MFDALNRNLRYLFLLNLAFGFSVQLVTPLFPLFLSNMGASAGENAMVISIGSLVSTALMLPSGLLLNRIGRRVLLIGSAAVSLVSIYLFSYASTWQQVIPVYALYSASMSLFIPARMAMITANSETEKRGSIFGIMNTSWPIAGVLSPIISGYLIESMGWNQVFVVGSAVNIIGILAGFKLSRVDLDVQASSGGDFRELLSGDILPVLLTFFAYGTLLSIALGGVNQIVPLYLDSRFKLSASQIGLFFTTQSLIMLITQIPSGALSDKYGRKRTLLSIIAPIPFLIASWHFVSDWRVMLVLNSLAFGLWSMTWPSILTLLSSVVPIRLAGAAFGLNTTGNRLGRTLGPIIASFFYVNYFQTMSFLVAGVICLTAVLVAFKIKDTDKD